MLMTARSVFKHSLLALLAMASQVQAADPIASQTKTVAGLNYKLSYAKPLHEGPQTLVLRVSRAGKPVPGLKLTAQAIMDDGMKSAIKISSKANGELALATQLDMAGEWQIKLQQSAPAKASLIFLVDVVGKPHHHSH